MANSALKRRVRGEVYISVVISTQDRVPIPYRGADGRLSGCLRSCCVSHCHSDRWHCWHQTTAQLLSQTRIHMSVRSLTLTHIIQAKRYTAFTTRTPRTQGQPHQARWKQCTHAPVVVSSDMVASSISSSSVPYLLRMVAAKQWQDELRGQVLWVWYTDLRQDADRQNHRSQS